jgi:hypothetical protein
MGLLGELLNGLVLLDHDAPGAWPSPTALMLSQSSVARIGNHKMQMAAAVRGLLQVEYFVRPK